MIRIRLMCGQMFVFGLLLVGAQQGFAANEGFMADDPVARFTAAQKRQQQEMLRDLTANAGEGETRSWQSSDGRVGGEGTVRRTFERKGDSCKDMSVRTWFRTLKATNDYRVCQNKEGKWYPVN